MKSWAVIGGMALLVAASSSVLLAQELTDTPEFAFHECPFTVPNRYEIDCGYLTVPEDRTSADNHRTIQVAVAVIHSDSDTPLPDPVIYLNGGPGGSSLPIISAGLSSLFETVLVNRDVIFVDQRGTGYSHPSLNCSEIEQLNPLTARSQFTHALVVCREHLVADGVNVAAYNSAASAADIADLRTALGYEAWNLYGVSYGTRLALTILRDHPQGVRSVILNSSLPPTASLYVEGGGNFQRSLQLLFETCQQDSICSLAYPALPSRLYDLLNQLDKQPIAIDGVSIDRFILTDLIFDAFYSPDVITRLPAAIYDISEGDYALLKNRAGSDTDNSTEEDKTFSEGMFYSVQCSEAASFHTYAEIMASLKSYPEAIQQYWQEHILFGAAALNACDVWLSMRPDPRENQPIYSDIPSLVLAGEFDPITPPQWGQDAAATLKGSYFYEFPGMGHNVAGSEPCPTSIILSFLNHPLKAPDSGCIKEMPHSTFLIRAAFSTPFVQGAVAIMVVIIVLWLACLRPYFRRWPFAWCISQHFVGGWGRNIGLIALVIIAYALTLPYWEQDSLHLRVLEIIFPFLFGLQTALIFPPDDEPALEVMLVCPRPVMFVVIERLLTLMIVQGSVIGTMTILSLTMPLAESLPLALARWLIPSFFIGSLTLYISIIARRATFGLLLTIVICMVSIVGTDYVVSGYPFLWFLHLYLQPADVISSIYFLNRLLLLMAGSLIFVRTLHLLANDEHMLNVK